MKGLNLHSDYHKAREEYKDGFEEIYSKAVESDVKLSNAKEFLSDLTQEELSTLQNYSQLANKINIDEISDEGAYNLLMHFYEKYDFDNDGFTENGNNKSISLIPQNIDSELKEALVNTINSSDEDNTLSLLALTLDIDQAKYDLAKHFDTMPDVQKEYIKQNSSFDFDNFVKSQLEEPYKQKKITYESIVSQLEYMLNLNLSEDTAMAFKENLRKFANSLENEYKNIKDIKSIDTQSAIQINTLVKNYKGLETIAEDSFTKLLQS